MFKPRIQSQKAKQLSCPFLCLLLAFPTYIGRYAHILHCSKLRQQLVELKNEAYLLIPEAGQLPGIKHIKQHTVTFNRSLIRPVKGSQYLQKGGLACTAGPHYSHYLPLPDIQINTFKDFQVSV